MRVFLGCFLDSASAQALAERVPAVRGMRPVPAANVHVTLHFIGHVEDTRVDEVKRLAAELPQQALSTRVTELAGFPGNGRARVLVARLEDAHGCLLRWHEVLAGRWPTGETRRFDPHATLARSRRALRLPALPDVSGLEVGLGPAAAYVSETLPEGARYRRLD